MSNQPIEIFRPGKWKSSDGKEYAFSAEEVASIASSYDPALHEAPVVVGHPKTDAPAYGWVKSLAVNKDGVLVATPNQVDAQFSELVRAGRFKKISASLYAPDSPNNPKPGSYYLRHVGFLGAVPPAVQGLRSPSFSANEKGVLEFGYGEQIIGGLLRRMREFIIEKFTAEDADRVLPSWELDSLQAEAAREAMADAPAAYAEAHTNQGEADMGAEAAQADLKKQQDDLAKQKADLDARDAALKAKELGAAKAAHVSFAKGLVKEGKLLPRDKAAAVELLTSLEQGGVIEFAEGDAMVKKPAAEWFKTFLEALPKQVDFSERAPAGEAELSDDATSIAARAQEFQAEQAKKGIEVRASDAVRAVTKR